MRSNSMCASLRAPGLSAPRCGDPVDALGYGEGAGYGAPSLPRGKL